MLFLDPHPVFQSDLSHPCSTNKSTSRPSCHSGEELRALVCFVGTWYPLCMWSSCICVRHAHWVPVLVDHIIAFWPPPATWLTARNLSLFISPAMASLRTPADVTLHTRASDPVMHHLPVSPAAELQLHLTHNLCPSAQVRCQGHKSHWLLKAHA